MPETAASQPAPRIPLLVAEGEPLAEARMRSASVSERVIHGAAAIVGLS